MNLSEIVGEIAQRYGSCVILDFHGHIMAYIGKPSRGENLKLYHYRGGNALDCTGPRELAWKVGFFPKFLTVGLRANDRADYGSWRAATQPEEH
jgi:hypothetical protein